MLRMIALDLDGTLLRSDKTLSARTRQVLEFIYCKGHACRRGERPFL